MEKIFGGINLTWKKVIIFAILAWIYTAVMAILPMTKDTSFADISITFEVWILFGILIIMNSKSAKDSALKCFVFFLISQPLVYLIQVPFSVYGFQLFNYYTYWFIWTVCTIPMGFIGYYMKKDKMWGLLILTPILILLGMHYQGFLNESLVSFPSHFLSTLFCFATLIIYPIGIFKDKKVRIVGAAISIIIIAVMSFFAITGNKEFYNTTILVNNGSEGITFDDKYKVYLKDEEYGKLYIYFDENLGDYVVNAEFKKGGKTEFIIEAQDGQKTTFDITIQKNTYSLERK